MKKLVKREKNGSPSATAPMWAIPTFTYVMGKFGGMEFNQFEFIWWVIIPILFLGWLCMNFKFK